MENRRNFYRILHVQRDAPLEVIQTSYRTLMQRLRMHPDLGGDPWQATVINEAFATLKDPVRRAAYDRGLGRLIVSREQAATDARLAPAESAATPGAEHPVPLVTCAFCETRHAPADATRPDALCTACASPLCRSVERPETDAAARAFHRSAREFALAFWLTWPQRAPCTGIATDLSIAGLRFRTPVELLLGERVKIDCAFCGAVAEVRHLASEPQGARRIWIVGAEFVTLWVKSPRGEFVSARA